MNKTAKSFLCLLLSLCVLFAACTPCLAAVSYPQGVTNESAAKAAEKTDRLIESAVSAFENTTLTSLVTEKLFESATLSKLLCKIYSTLWESRDTLAKLGIDVTPAGVAKHLSDYPTVEAPLSKALDWSEDDLKGARWNVYDKYDFASAMAAMLAPFNDVLYTVLCGGTYKVGVIRINGSKAYETGLVSMLEALGCTWCERPGTFYAQADGNKNSMVWDITISVFSMLEDLLSRPAMKFSEMLPNLAYYIKDGGLESSVDELLKPFSLHIGNLVSLFSGSQMLSLLMFLQSPQKYTTNFSENINTVLADMTAQSDIKLAEIDLDALKSCGTQSGSKVTANIGESFTLTAEWLIDTLKLNADKMQALLKDNEDMKSVLPLLENLLKKDTGEIFKMFVTLLTSEKGEEVDYEWTQKDFSATQVQYTQNLGKEKYQRVLDGIDAVISEFMVEFGDGKNLKTTLKNTIYSGDILAKLAKSLYTALSDEKLQLALGALGISVSPDAVAGHLRKSGYYSAASYLSGSYSWKNISEKSFASCFKSGSRNYFEGALTAVLMPLEPVFEMLFANGTLTVLNSITIPGTNGYNSAVIPILEALGCPEKNILSFRQYEKCKGSDKIISAVLDPVLDLVDKICKKPVYTLTDIIPNLIYFVSNGSLFQCIDNLTKPLFDLLEPFGVSASSLGFDLDKLKKTDILGKVSAMIPKIAKDMIKLKKPDLKSLAGMGSLVKVQSKRTYSGKTATIYKVEADQTAVLITILRYIIGATKDPENSKVLSTMMTPQDGGDNNMFAQYSSGIGDQMATQTTDETIEWLYKLFFRERAVAATTEPFVYDKEIIYQSEKKTNKAAIASPIILILVALVVLAIFKRDRIEAYLENRKLKKAEKKAAKKEA